MGSAKTKVQMELDTSTVDIVIGVGLGWVGYLTRTLFTNQRQTTERVIALEVEARATDQRINGIDDKLSSIESKIDANQATQNAQHMEWVTIAGALNASVEMLRNRLDQNIKKD